MKHYLDYGQFEVRSLNSFESVAYLLTHSDLRGTTAGGALDHYLAFGADQGRSPSGAFGFEQTNHALVGPVGDTIGVVGDKDWFSISVQTSGQQSVALSKGTTSGALTQGVLSVFDATGNAVSAVVTETASSMSLSFSAAQGAIFYIVVESAGGRGTYTLSHSSPSPGLGALAEDHSKDAALTSIAALASGELEAPYLDVDLGPFELPRPYGGGYDDLFA